MLEARKPLPPGPRGAKEILDVVLERRRDPLRLYTRLYEKYGTVFYFTIGKVGYCFVCDPVSIKHVLMDKHKIYPKGPGYERLREFIGNGLLTSEGELWRQQRKLSQPAFHRDSLMELSKMMTVLSQKLVERLEPISRNGQEFEVTAEMMRVTLDIVGQTLLGRQSFEERADEVRESVTRMMTQSENQGTSLLRVLDLFPFSKTMGIPLSIRVQKSLPTSRNFRYQRAIRFLDEIVYKIIADGRKAAQGKAKDLLSMFMRAQDEENGKKMSDIQLRDEVRTMFIAGHETTATALTWTLYLIASHPEVESKIRDELKCVLGDRAPAFEDLAQLKYLQMAFDESIRMYPPFWRLSKRAIEEDEIAGFLIPKDTVMVVSPYLAHRNKEYWPDPEKFDPDRFTSEAIAQRPKFIHIPYGGGPRSCIGANFASMESLLIIATLMQNYRLKLVPGQKIGFDPKITLRAKGGIRMTAESLRGIP